MHTYFFLGANSEAGFYSLYDQFCAAPSDMLHIIKGGPGTGKSTFMRRIGKAAEEHGFDVEYILCSGDPTSLDGVYIPALHVGWADGTAPHALEPRLFGASADYVNLGSFCNIALLAEGRPLIATLTDAYRNCYKTAYAYLNAAGTLQRAVIKTLSPETEHKIRKRARSKIRRECSAPTHPVPPVKRFISAISCCGESVVDSTVNALCDRLCVLESHFGLEQVFFSEIISELSALGVAFIHCPCPLCPDMTDAVILPNEKLCFLSSRLNADFYGTVRTIHLDAYLPNNRKREYATREKLCTQLKEAAVSWLKNAKKLHDDLELCYRPALDINALEAYTNQIISELFP